MGKTFVLFALAMIALACSTAMAQAPAEPGTRPPPTVTVTGTGEVHARPDFAQVQMGVVTEGATAAEALTWIEKQMVPYYPLGDYKVIDAVARLN